MTHRILGLIKVSLTYFKGQEIPKLTENLMHISLSDSVFLFIHFLFKRLQKVMCAIALFACAVGFYLMAYNTPAKQQWCLSVNIVIVD